MAVVFERGLFMEILYETHHSDRGLDRHRRPRERAVPQSKSCARSDYGKSGASADSHTTGGAGTAACADASQPAGGHRQRRDAGCDAAQPGRSAAKIDRSASRSAALKCGALALALVAVATPASAQFLNPSPAGPTLGSSARAPSSTFGDPAKGPNISPPLGKQAPYVPPPDSPLPAAAGNVVTPGVRPPSLAIPPN